MFLGYSVAFDRLRYPIQKILPYKSDTSLKLIRALSFRIAPTAEVAGGYLNDFSSQLVIDTVSSYFQLTRIVTLRWSFGDHENRSSLLPTMIGELLRYDCNNTCKLQSVSKI